MLIMLSGSAFSGPLTCWYNAQGESTSANSGSYGVPENQYDQLVTSPENNGADYVLSWVLSEWVDGDSCPRTVEVSTTVDVSTTGKSAKSNLVSLDDSRETCGNNSNMKLRARGCSDIISNPLADIKDVTWALWSRSYVLCGTVANNEIIADLMTAARLDPQDWQTYFKKVGGYTGKVGGKLNMELYEAINRYVKRGCR